ncbi:MAG: IPT/TIG domain-containing protein, partial [Methylococcales bacterium]|nr:IPT/TIG domain-containing protein [Methylococcales bacterium]
SAVTPNNGPASGGTAVTLSGLQFGPEASVLFGEVLASDIIVISENQINCTTPSHYPALVEVSVLNTNGTQSTLLNGFSFEDDNAVVSMPADVTGDFGALVEIPLSIANVSGLRAAQITLTYDSSILDAQSGRLGELVAGWGYVVNTATAGQVIISMAKETTVTGSGTLAYLTFNVVGAPSDSTALTLSSVSLNDGAISATTSHGLFTANAFWSLGGSVTHFNGEPVENASLSIAGTDSQSEATASDGAFAFTNLLTGNYILTPSKSDDANGISAYDASLVLQHSAGLLSLSAAQIVAADVNRSGVVSPMDASYILEHAVGLIGVPFPNAGKVWDFLPTERSYAPL